MKLSVCFCSVIYHNESTRYFKSLVSATKILRILKNLKMLSIFVMLTEHGLKAEILHLWAKVMIKKTLNTHMVQTSHRTFHVTEKPRTINKGKKAFIIITINESIHRSLSVSWYLLQLLSCLAWDERHFIVSKGIMQSVMSHKMQTSLHICSQQKQQNRIKKIT